MYTVANFHNFPFNNCFYTTLIMIHYRVNLKDFFAGQALGEATQIKKGKDIERGYKSNIHPV